MAVRIEKGGWILIFLIGLALNAFPFFWWGKIAGNPDPSFLDRFVYRYQHLRYLGVLQRIGIVYLIAGLISLRATRKQIIVTAVAILLGYWILIMAVPVPGIGSPTFCQPPLTSLVDWI